MRILMQSCLVFIFIFITGCVTQFNEQNWVTLSQEASINLADPPSGLVVEQWQQILDISYQGEQQTLLSIVNIDAVNGISLTVMTAQGMPIFSLEKQVGRPLMSKKMLPISSVDPRYILADMMIVHWPEQALIKQLNGASVQDSKNQRQIFQGDKLIIDVNYTEAETVLRHSQRDYTIKFQRINPL